MALLADASAAPRRSAAGLTDAPAGARLDPAANIAVEGLRDGRFGSWSLDEYRTDAGRRIANKAYHRHT
ncbi:hypothetical protein ACFYUG_17120 [Streptomyces albogriseolus]|uniref:hypothetical protein n=1 Tax=Streptomyces albogriseolus TaxID=1887 RepID=UPI0036C63FBD